MIFILIGFIYEIDGFLNPINNITPFSPGFKLIIEKGYYVGGNFSMLIYNINDIDNSKSLSFSVNSGKQFYINERIVPTVDFRLATNMVFNPDSTIANNGKFVMNFSQANGILISFKPFPEESSLSGLGFSIGLYSTIGIKNSELNILFPVPMMNLFYRWRTP